MEQRLEAFVISDTEASGLQEKINTKLKEIGEKGICENVRIDYSTTAIPQIRGDKVTGYKAEHSVVIILNVVSCGRKDRCSR